MHSRCYQKKNVSPFTGRYYHSSRVNLNWSQAIRGARDPDGNLIWIKGHKSHGRKEVAVINVTWTKQRLANRMIRFEPKMMLLARVSYARCRSLDLDLTPYLPHPWMSRTLSLPLSTFTLLGEEDAQSEVIFVNGPEDRLYQLLTFTGVSVHLLPAFACDPWCLALLPSFTFLPSTSPLIKLSLAKICVDQIPNRSVSSWMCIGLPIVQ